MIYCNSIKRKTQILLVDDDDYFSKTLKEELDSDGYRCDTASSGTEALQAIKKTSYELVLCDYLMPQMDGLCLTKKIRRQYDADVIIISGFQKDISHESISEAGASDYIRKPFKYSDLSARMKRVLFDRTNRLKLHKAKKTALDHLNTINDSYKKMVELMASLVEMRDPYTSGHQIKVANIAALIGKRLGMGKRKLEGLFLAGLVHDIGKMNIPAEYLVKPSTLTDIERQMIQLHAATGYQLLKTVNFPWRIADMVHQHHERLDGSGYPLRLFKNEILLEAKILGVADTLEAMMSHRPYRPALGIDAAMEELCTKKNILYDSDAVDACIELYKNNELSVVFDNRQPSPNLLFSQPS